MRPLSESGALTGSLSGSRVASGMEDEDSPGAGGEPARVEGADFPAPDGAVSLPEALSSASSSSAGGVVPGGGGGLCARAPELAGCLSPELRFESPDPSDDEPESESGGGATLLDSPESSLELGGAEAEGEFGSLGGGRCEGSCARAEAAPIKNNVVAKNTASGIRFKLRR